MFGSEEPTQIEGNDVNTLFTTEFDDISDQSIEPQDYIAELGNPWGNPHCLQSAIPRAFGFFTVMYCLTRMGRWKRARRRMSMIVYRGFYDKIIPFYFNKYRIRRKRRFQTQSKWFVSWQLLPCFWAFIWPQGFLHANPRTNYANFTILLAPLASRPRLWLRAWRRPRLVIKPIVAGLIIGMLFAFFRGIFSVVLYVSRTYSGFWRPIMWEQQYHKKKILQKTAVIWTKQAQHKARLQGAYEILSNPATNIQPTITLPTAAELAQRAADVPLIDDSVKYGKDVSDFVPDAVLTFRQFLQTAQDTVKDLAVNPYTPPPSSKLSKGSVLRKEDVETYFMEAWEEDVQYRPAFPPPSPAILVPTRGGRWTPEPPKPYTFLDKILTQPDSLKGENWPQNINDWKSGTDYRVFERRSARHLYDDWSRYHQMEGGLHDIDNELYVEPKFPRIPDLQYIWVKRFADQYWSPEDDWVFTNEEYAESVKKRTPVL